MGIFEKAIVHRWMGRVEKVKEDISGDAAVTGLGNTAKAARDQSSGCVPCPLVWLTRHPKPHELYHPHGLVL